MRRMVIRYRTRPDSAAENQKLIEDVFRELQEKAPAGVRYAALRLEDDVFVHLVEVKDEAGANPIVGLDAFKVFQHGVRARCADVPVQADARIIGNYGMLGER